MHTRSSVENVNAYLKAHNCGTIVGVDEAGRGCWAGPICAAAAAVPTSMTLPPEITDSKKLGSSDKGRAKMEAIYEQFKNHDRIAIGIGIVDAAEIDEIGIDKAQAKAQGKAIRSIFDRLAYKPFVVVDGINPPALGPDDAEEVLLVPKADALIPAVSLASIFAKVTQIRYMRDYGAKYPMYGFSSHCAYGTKAHQAALKQYGPCPIHRHSYRPVREATKAALNLEGQHIDDILAELTSD